MKTITSGMILMSMLSTVAFGAKNIYVCAGGLNPDESKYDSAYGNLQAAIDAAATGDTVWVKNGFVCDAGATTNSGVSRIYCSKGITVRSESGTWENGAVIRGAYHNGADDPLGENAVRCLRIESNKATFIGFRLEDGATIYENSFGASVYGGGIYGVGTVSNCFVTGCKATRGGGCGSSNALHLDNCVVSNNWAKLEGGGVSGVTATGTRIVYNLTDGTSGGARGGNYRFCDISHNTAGTGNGAGILGASDVMEDCIVSYNTALAGNIGGFGYLPHLTRCQIFGNRVCQSNGNAGGIAGTNKNNPAVLVDCVISNNFAGGKGGGVLQGVLVNCQVVDNVCSNNGVNWGCGMGGGVSECVLTNCLVSGNIASGGSATGSAGYGGGGGIHSSTCVSCVITANTCTGRGAGLVESTAWNCTVSCNTNYYGAGGAGSWGGTFYNTLFVGNCAYGGHSGVAGWDASKNPASASVPKLYNCTVVDNIVIGSSGIGGCSGVFAVNTISWGNTNGGSSKEDIYYATNCCFEASGKVAYGENNWNVDPKLGVEAGFAYVPQAGSVCKDSALLYPWMTDSADVRSVALNGFFRLRGNGVDVGCYESEPRGFKFVLR